MHDKSQDCPALLSPQPHPYPNAQPILGPLALIPHSPPRSSPSLSSLAPTPASPHLSPSPTHSQPPLPTPPIEGASCTPLFELDPRGETRLEIFAERSQDDKASRDLTRALSTCYKRRWLLRLIIIMSLFLPFVPFLCNHTRQSLLGSFCSHLFTGPFLRPRGYKVRLQINDDNMLTCTYVIYRYKYTQIYGQKEGQTNRQLDK